VTAHFENGTAVTGSLIVGAEGANSKVREYLLGPENAALQTLPLGIGTVASLPAEISRKVRGVNDLYSVSYHPEGICTFVSRM
jgi:2-polyprenyl-6-methoxyphenol hydroxylase-like FAD-dependent oxidoreductase